MSALKIIKFLALAVVVSAISPACVLPRKAGNEWFRLNQTFTELYQSGSYAGAAMVAEQSLRVAEKKRIGPDDPDIATSLNNLGLIYGKQARYTDAELLHLRALTIREKALGPNHPTVAECLNHLGEIYSTQGKYVQAEPLHQRALTINELTFGFNHPNVATTLNSLGDLYSHQGQNARAEPPYLRSLAIREEALGADHPDVASSLNGLADLYYIQGKYTQAEPLYQRSLAILEQAFGPDHPDVASSLNGLADLHAAQEQYAQAEPLYSRSLAIRESALGRDHPDVAASLDGLAEIYFQQADFPRTESLLKRSLAIRESALGVDHPDVASSLDGLADLYGTQGQYPKAMSLARRSLAIREKALGPSHPSTAESVNSLAVLYDELGQYAQAEAHYLRALEIVEAALGPEHRHVADVLSNLAVFYEIVGQYAQVEPLYERALAIREKELGADHSDVALSLDSLAGFYASRSEYARAEPLAQRALVITEKTLGSDHPDVATSLNTLANIYFSQGEFDEAEPLYTRALVVREKSLGPDHPGTAESLNNLAQLFEYQGRYAQADPLYRRALTIVEETFGYDHSDVATSLNHLAEVYERQGKHSLAAPLFQRALAIKEKALGPKHLEVAECLENLAIAYSRQGKHEQAEALLQRALEIRESTLGPGDPLVASTSAKLAFLYSVAGQHTKGEGLMLRSLAMHEKADGPDHPAAAPILSYLAGYYFNRGQYDRAQPMLERAHAIHVREFGPEHPLVAQDLNNLANLHRVQGRHADALSLSRKASEIYRKRISDAGAEDYALWDASRNRGGFVNHLSGLTLNPGSEPAVAITNESFKVVQLTQATSTSAAVAKMALRFAKSDNAIATLVKRRQDAANRHARSEAQLVQAAGQPAGERYAEQEQVLREETARLRKEINTIDDELTLRFPEYQELTRTEPLTIAQVQFLLHPDEAMLVYEISEEQSWVWIVRTEMAEFLPLAVKKTELADHVKRVRLWMERDASGYVRKIDVALLHALQQQLLAPVKAQLGGIKHLILIPSGPLQSLPFSMLVMSQPDAGAADKDYAEIDWMAKHHALSVLPSVSSIRAFRQFAKSGAGQNPFIGFGDPLLRQGSGAERDLAINPSDLFRGLKIVANPGPSSQPPPPIIAELSQLVPTVSPRQLDIADVETIRQQVRLPETAKELEAMAKIMRAAEGALWLQDQATETNVKSQDLSRYRVVAFATHGVMAGEMPGGMEAGLLLTPPAEGTLDDDGYLSASEIALLKLNADWVLLSACNTAAPDGTPGAEGLSGLAKAFFYAGARSILVSHWAVASEATVPLITQLLRQYQGHPEQGKAEALRQSMLALMRTPEHPEYAHPLFWAPFEVVGEGAGGVFSE